MHERGMNPRFATPIGFGGPIADAEGWKYWEA